MCQLFSDSTSLFADVSSFNSVVYMYGLFCSGTVDCGRVACYSYDRLVRLAGVTILCCGLLESCAD